MPENWSFILLLATSPQGPASWKMGLQHFGETTSLRTSARRAAAPPSPVRQGWRSQPAQGLRPDPEFWRAYGQGELKPSWKKTQLLITRQISSSSHTSS